ncbi:MAG: hypothetical protein JW751_27550 [Polyangiaceae bacterium]|nr:hypothetical protein [Polyangiaceae bacterium]
MPTVDSDHHAIEMRVVVLGGASTALLAQLPLREGSLTLGSLQGWRPTMVFRGYGVDPWASDGAEGRDLETFLPYADGLILTDGLAGGAHYSSTAVERLWRSLGPNQRGIPTAVFGFHALAEEWQTLSGVEPVAIVDPRPEAALSVVKAVAGALLRSRLRSIPPPPPPVSV